MDGVRARRKPQRFKQVQADTNRSKIGHPVSIGGVVCVADAGDHHQDPAEAANGEPTASRLLGQLG